jgi:hypothetical protein
MAADQSSLTSPSPFHAGHNSEKARFDRLSFMSTTTADISLPFSPFHAVIHDGIDRLMDLMKHDSFTFVVNGEELESTIPEAVALSPTLHASLQSNPLLTTFEFARDSVNSSDFVDFLHFVRSRGSVTIPRDRVLSFISISGQLGNERLALLLLSSLKSDSSVHSESQSQSLPSSARAAV